MGGEKFALAGSPALCRSLVSLNYVTIVILVVIGRKQEVELYGTVLINQEEILAILKKAYYSRFDLIISLGLSR